MPPQEMTVKILIGEWNGGPAGVQIGVFLSFLEKQTPW
jgi:hypothetical protein